MDFAGLIPVHYMNYLIPLSDLRDSVLYIGDLLLLSLSLCCMCISRFVFFVRRGARQLLLGWQIRLRNAATIPNINRCLVAQPDYY